jgi:hypothetical protein
MHRSGHPKSSLYILLACAGAGVSCTTTTLLAQPPVVPMALTDASTPPLSPAGVPNGVRFSGFGGPLISSDGLVAFTGTLTGPGVSSTNNSGLWFGQPGQLSLIARTGDQPPSTSMGVRYSGFTNLVCSGSHVLFIGTLAGTGITSANDRGLWTGSNGVLNLAARKGAQAPGTQPGVTFAGLTGAVLSTDGLPAFLGSLTGPGVTPGVNAQGLWGGPKQNLHLLARQGSPAQGLPAGVNYGTVSGPLASRFSNFAFVAGLSGSGAPPGTDQALFAGIPGGFSPSVRLGSQAPETAPGVAIISISSPSAHAEGVAFLAEFSGPGIIPGVNSTGLYMTDPSGTRLRLRTGQPAPGTGPGVVFSDLISAAVASNGHVLVSAVVSGTGVTPDNNNGLWAGAPGAMTLVAREGAQAPNLPPNVRLSTFAGPMINRRGQVAFWATLFGPGISLGVNDRGIFGWDPQTGLHLLARLGDTVEIIPGAMRTITGLTTPLSSSSTAVGDADGRASVLSSDGLVVFSAQFSNGTAGVLLTRLPSAPSGCTVADIASTSASPGPDGCLNNGDFVLFFASFLAGCEQPGGIPCNPADIARTDGSPGPDGRVDNGDFLQFITALFRGVCDDCPE